MNSSTQIDPWWRERIFGVDYSNLVDQCLMTIENTEKIENFTLSSYNSLKEKNKLKLFQICYNNIIKLAKINCYKLIKIVINTKKFVIVKI